MYLFNFLFDTFQKRMNDPNNERFWLPKTMGELQDPDRGAKLLPLQGENWDLGKIKGEASDLITNVMTQQAQFVMMGLGQGELLRDHTVIACPDDPNPGLKFTTAVIHGLDNLFLEAHPPVNSSKSGYQTSLTFELDHYLEKEVPEGAVEETETPPTPVLPKFSVNGKYLLTQCLCLAKLDDPTKCANSLNDEINGTGDFNLDINNAFIVADVNILSTGEGPNRSLKVEITQLRLQGPLEGEMPELVVNNLTIDSEIEALEPFWIAAATNAITSQEGQEGLFANLNASLNTPDKLAQLSEMMTEKLKGSIDNMMGPVGEGELPTDPRQAEDNQADVYIYDRIRVAMNNPVSEWYLPKSTSELKNPAIDPLVIDQINLPDQNIGGMPFTNMLLSNITFTGFSNAIAPPKQISFSSESDVVMIVDLGTLNPPPRVNGKVIPAPPIKGKGTFSVKAFGTYELTSPFTVTLNKSQVKFTMSASGGDVDSLDLAIKHTEVLQQNSDMIIDLQLQSMFKAMINGGLNKQSMKESFIDKLNIEIAKKQPTISEQFAQATKAGIAERLDS